MKIWCFKLKKILMVITGVLMLTFIIFLSSVFVGTDEMVKKPLAETEEKEEEKILNKDDGKAIEKDVEKEDKEINGIEFKSAEKAEQEVMEIFPREDYDDWEVEHDQEFFVEYRLQRERIRAKEIEELNQLIDKDDISQEVKNRAENNLLEVLSAIKKEMVIENLIKAHGFDDAIFFYGEESATVVIKAESLSETEVYQISELISDKTDINMNNIRVVEKGF